LVEIRPVANAQNEWVALLLGVAGGAADVADPAALRTLFGNPDLLAAVAPLDCVVLLESATVLTPPVLELMPPNRVVLAVRAGALAEEGAARRLADLQLEGYRVMLDGELPPGMARPPALRTVARDCAGDAATSAPAPASLPALFGPHLAHGVDSLARFHDCENAGFTWFAGAYPLENALDHPPKAGEDQCCSRKRLLTLLALLARDADSRELELQLKQDPALSYHLLKLVNSAAFSCGTPITSFGQAISRIGRRQLQRWLQLLLYARQQPDGPLNLLLPLAAMRGAALEALCKRDGAGHDERDECDLVFMTGVFSLLDRLFHMPMDEVLRDLRLPAHVEAALLHREGRLGQRLRLLDTSRPQPEALAAAAIDSAAWWQSQLHAYHWAIQVARNV
jgi:EAL and modified HD-GYP domain-containing signal transduction protein